MDYRIEKLKKELQEMVDLDQFLRLNTKHIHPDRIRPEKYDPAVFLATMHELTPNLMIYIVDHAHNVRLRRIFQQFNQLTTEAIGSEAMHNLWLLVQHQDYDHELQNMALVSCDFEPADKAYLTDRVLVNSDQKQRFGTQYTRSVDGTLVLRELEDARGVHDLRAQADLPPLEDTINR